MSRRTGVGACEPGRRSSARWPPGWGAVVALVSDRQAGTLVDFFNARGGDAAAEALLERLLSGIVRGLTVAPRPRALRRRRAVVQRSRVVRRAQACSRLRVRPAPAHVRGMAPPNDDHRLHGERAREDWRQLLALLSADRLPEQVRASLDARADLRALHRRWLLRLHKLADAPRKRQRTAASDSPRDTSLQQRRLPHLIRPSASTRNDGIEAGATGAATARRTSPAPRLRRSCGGRRPSSPGRCLPRIYLYRTGGAMFLVEKKPRLRRVG